MISIRRADLLERIKDKREKITLILAICMNNGKDTVFFWNYNSNGKIINLSSYDNFLYNVMLNAMQVTGMSRSYEIFFNDSVIFDENSQAFTVETHSQRKASMYSMLMQDFYTAMKRGAPAFVGESEHHFNDKGVCFGVIELFKPKFSVGEYAKFKKEDGEVASGLIVGLDGTSGKYTVTSEGVDVTVSERDLSPVNSIKSSISFRKRADLLLSIQEKQKQKEEAEREADRIDKHPLSSLPEHPQISEMIKDTCEKFGEKMRDMYEAYGNELKELPSQSYDGFHNFTNGGWKSEEYTILDHMHGSGYWPSNEKFYEAVQKQLAEGFKDAMDEFIREHKNELIAAKIDPSIPKNLKKIDYHNLYKMGHGKLAEALSECESETLAQYQYTFYFYVFYYSPDNRNKEFEDGLPEISITAGVDGSYDLQVVDERFSFSTLSQLREKLTSCLNQAVEALD